MKKIFLVLLLLIIASPVFAERVEYPSNGQMRSIGDKKIEYKSNGQIRSVGGEQKVDYHSNGQVRSIGDERVEYVRRLRNFEQKSSKIV